MNKLNQEEIQIFITEKVMTPFSNTRLAKLKELSFKEVMMRKNPYLFKAKNIQTAEELVRYVLDAYLSSQEETIFGNLMEELAIFVCGKVFGGYKAEQKKFKSVDLIFHKDETIYIVGIKSGPNWGNSDQLSRMRDNFKEARKILKSEGNSIKIVAINGCMYGKDNVPFKKHKTDRQKDYYKYCGQEFWEFVTGDSEFYQKIVAPIDKEAKKKDEDYRSAYASKINELTKEFSQSYLTGEDRIDWEKLIDFVSKKINNPRASTRTPK